MLTFVLCFIGAVWGFVTIRAARAYRFRRACERNVALAMRQHVPCPMGGYVKTFTNRYDRWPGIRG